MNEQKPVKVRYNIVLEFETEFYPENYGDYEEEFTHEDLVKKILKEKDDFLSNEWEAIGDHADRIDCDYEFIEIVEDE